MGLGKAFATKLLEAGAMVCISDVDEATGKKWLQNRLISAGLLKNHV